ncbi:MAG TPA: hypothetical protein VFW11_11785 [Cyclobacteriaceae bacterium]|nr:hypothetical protein [Cyclobacteriaceae bacterium]
MLEEITQQFWQASEKRRACRIKLNGEPLPRMVHPYGVCRTTADKIVLVCWQSMGFTKPGGREGYRNLSLHDIIEVEMVEYHFKKREDFNPSDSQYKEWVYHI